MSKLRKVFFIILVLGAGLAAGLYIFLPTGPRDPDAFADWQDPQAMLRDVYQADDYLVVAGNPWAAAAARDAIEAGGTACDAAVAAVLMLNVTFSEASSFPSVAPTLVFDAQSGTVRSYIGAGRAPRAATIELFRERGHTTHVPKNSILSQLVPASPDVLTALLADCGVRTFADAVAPAIRTAREGFPVHRTMLRNFDMPFYKRFGFSILLPYNAEVFLDGQWWRPLHHKDRFRLPDLARTFEELVAAERAAYSGGAAAANASGGPSGEAERLAGLAAVRQYFYEGPLAEKIVAFHEEEGGLITRADLAEYRGGFEAPLSADIGDYRLFTNRTWTQGIVVLEALQILRDVDLRALGHNTPAYIHTVAQAIELAMADREAYVGDPDFVDVPVDVLLSPQFADRRRELMTFGDAARAFGETPPPGDVGRGQTRLWRPRRDTTDGASAGSNLTGTSPKASPANASTRLQRLARLDHIDLGPNRGQAGRDTSYVAVVDRRGNSVSMTPSDFPLSPMVPETGLTLGIRMTQFRLDPGHPSALEPGKRPRITPHALMALRRSGSGAGQLALTFGTPGGEMQTQALVQFFLNHTVFGMDVQKAVEAPRFRSKNWPDAFSPHEYFPGVIDLEASLAGAAPALEAMGYTVELYPDLDNGFSAVGAIRRDGERLTGGADPREETWAEGR